MDHKKTYTIRIQEVLTRDVEIDAKSEEEAFLKAESLYRDSEIVLDESDFNGEPIYSLASNDLILEDYESMSSENKFLASFLEKQGYSANQISEIALCGSISSHEKEQSIKPSMPASSALIKAYGRLHSIGVPCMLQIDSPAGTYTVKKEEFLQDFNNIKDNCDYKLCLDEQSFSADDVLKQKKEFVLFNADENTAVFLSENELMYKAKCDFVIDAEDTAPVSNTILETEYTDGALRLYTEYSDYSSAMKISEFLFKHNDAFMEHSEEYLASERERLKSLLIDNSLSLSLYETSEIYGENGDVEESDPYYEFSMYEAQIEDTEEDTYNDCITGRYCDVVSVIEELESFIEVCNQEYIVNQEVSRMEKQENNASHSSNMKI